MRKAIIAGVFLLFLNFPGHSQSPDTDKKGETTVTFRFLPGRDMFYIPWNGNDTELNRLYVLVDEYRSEIMSGRMPVHVDGYCASGENTEAGFGLAVTRSNRVKSELITNKGLAEEHFVTKNHATAYTASDGTAYRDMVVVTLRIPAGKEPEPVSPADDKVNPDPQPVVEQKPEPQPVVEERPEPEPEPQVIIPQPLAPTKPYCFAVRTNLLYDAFLTPTLGIEWRVIRNIGIKVDGSRSWWGDAGGKVQKIWLVSPEVRWYLGQVRRLYVGASATIGEYNIYKGMLGSLISDDTGYQGKLYGGGLTVGYQLYLSRGFSLDFNLGLGYTRLKYDSFTVTEGVRIYKEKDKTKNFFGPTQAGISLVWTIGANR